MVKGIELASPAELSRLGVCEARKLAVLAVLALGSFLLLVRPLTLASEPRFFSRTESLEFGREDGGGGKAAMLLTLRIDLAAGIPEALPAEEDALGISVVDCD